MQTFEKLHIKFLFDCLRAVILLENALAPTQNATAVGWVGYLTHSLIEDTGAIDEMSCLNVSPFDQFIENYKSIFSSLQGGVAKLFLAKLDEGSSDVGVTELDDLEGTHLHLGHFLLNDKLFEDIRKEVDVVVDCLLLETVFEVLADGLRHSFFVVDWGRVGLPSCFLELDQGQPKIRRFVQLFSLEDPSGFDGSSCRDKLAGHSYKVISELDCIWIVLGVSLIDEVGRSSLFIGDVDLVACDIEYFGQKVYLDEVDEDEVSSVEDELEAENRIEFEMHLYFFFEEEPMQFFHGLNDP